MKVNESVTLNHQLYALVQASVGMYNTSRAMTMEFTDEQEESLCTQLAQAGEKLLRVNNNLRRLCGLEPQDPYKDE